MTQKHQQLRTKSNLTKTSKQYNKIKRGLKTEPITYRKTEEQQQANKAKDYLLSLDEDGQFSQFLLKPKQQAEIGLCQWNQTKTQQHNRMSSRVANSLDIKKLKQQIRYEQGLCSFEIQLVERQNNRNHPISMRNSDSKQFLEHVTSNKITVFPQSKTKFHKKTSFLQSIQVSLPKKQLSVSVYINKQKLTRIEGPPNVDLTSMLKLKHNQNPVKHVQNTSQIKKRLPQLNYRQEKHYKIKYKSAFSNCVRKPTLSLSKNSHIHKEIGKIYDLIREENLTLIKKPL